MRKKVMMEKIGRIVELSYLQLVVIFLILALLIQLDVLSLPINYQLFIVALPLLAIPYLLHFKPSEETGLRPFVFIVLAVFLFALFIRLFPSPAA